MKNNQTKLHTIIPEQIEVQTLKDAILHSNLAQTCKLTEDFIKENQEVLNWKDISTYQILSESFIEEFINKLDLVAVSRSQCLSEAFMEKHASELCWNELVRYQNMTDAFLDRHNDKYSLYYAFLNSNISDNFKIEHKDFILSNTWNHDQAVELMFHLRNSSENPDKMKELFATHLTKFE